MVVTLQAALSANCYWRHSYIQVPATIYAAVEGSWNTVLDVSIIRNLGLLGEKRIFFVVRVQDVY